MSGWTFTVEENPGGGQSLALIDDSDRRGFIGNGDLQLGRVLG